MSSSSSERAAIAAQVYEVRLSPEEFEKRLQAQRDPEQDKERLALIDWFCKRYPTPLERLRYCTSRARLWKPKNR